MRSFRGSKSQRTFKIKKTFLLGVQKNPDHYCNRENLKFGQSNLRSSVLPRSGDIESYHEITFKEIILIKHIILLIDNSFRITDK